MTERALHGTIPPMYHCRSGRRYAVPASTLAGLLALLACGCASCPPGKDCSIPRTLAGLSVRAEIDTPEVELGAEVKIRLLLEFDPAEAPASTELLNRYVRARKVKVTFRDPASGVSYQRDVVDESLGMPVWPGEEDLHSLRSAKLSPETVSVRLLSREGEQVPPGKYEVTVTYQNEGATEVTPNPAKEYADRLWTGRIISPAVPLRVVPAATALVPVEIPPGIEVKLSGDNPRGIVARWRQDDFETVRVTVHPGYILGMEARICLSTGGKERECLRTLGESLTWSDDAMIWLTDEELALPDSERPIVKMHLRIFETSEPPRHLWMPRIGDFRVLRFRLYSEEIPMAPEEPESGQVPDQFGAGVPSRW